MANFDEDIINKRDDVAAAVFAAQLGAELTFIDKQATNRPDMQPQANRTNPKQFLRTPVPNVPVAPPPQPIQYDPYNMANNVVQPRALQDIMIPLPEDIKPPTKISPLPPSLAPNNGPVQLELPMTINEKGKPQNPEQWFNYLEKKLDDMDVRWTIEIQKVGKAVRDLTRVLEDKRIIRLKSKQEL